MPHYHGVVNVGYDNRTTSATVKRVRKAGGRKKDAAGGEAGGKRKKGKKAAGKGGGKGRGGAVVTVAGKKYRVRVVPADRAGKKGDRPKAD